MENGEKELEPLPQNKNLPGEKFMFHVKQCSREPAREFD
jgi:hypothetical protein